MLNNAVTLEDYVFHPQIGGEMAGDRAGQYSIRIMTNGGSVFDCRTMLLTT
jgi:hypothetical protein